MLGWVRRAAFATVLVALGSASFAGEGFGQTTLKVALHSDLKILDPIWSTALISTHHGYMVYDTLFALDEKLEIKPQMVDTWESSPDKLTWTFQLRDGLSWHDGAPVTAEDCVASLRRFGSKDTMGQKLFSKIAELSAPDPKTISIVLKEPYGLVLETLAKPGANVPFMMPRRIAAGDPNVQVLDAVGSGPFIFKKDEWRVGEKAVYVRNPNYKPRAEPPSGLAGGKVVKVDRVEWLSVGDIQTAVNALLVGEIDMVESVPPDLMPLLAKAKDVQTTITNPAGRQYVMRFNVLHRPFDNPKVRQAVLYGLNQKEILQAAVGDPTFYRECHSIFPCGSPLESTKGWSDLLLGNVAKAKQLLAEAGYDGSRVVLLHQTDLPSAVNIAPVVRAQLEKIGLKVDMQSMDWQTVVARRTRKDVPSAGGWSAYFSSWASVDILDPVAAAFLNASCDKAPFGWPCDPRLEELREEFAKTSNLSRQKEIAEAVQLRAVEYPTYAPLGQSVSATGLRTNIVGLLHSPSLAFWNVEKKLESISRSSDYKMLKRP